MTLFGDQVTALVRKNILLKRRKWISTLLEIILPCLVLFGLAWIESKSGNMQKSTDYHNSKMYYQSLESSAKFLGNRLHELDSHLAIIPASMSDIILDVVPFPESVLNLQFETETEMEKYISKVGYGISKDQPHIYAAIVMDDMEGPAFKYSVRTNCTKSMFGDNYQNSRSTDTSVMKTLQRHFTKEYEVYTDYYLFLQTLMDFIIMDRAGALPELKANAGHLASTSLGVDIEATNSDGDDSHSSLSQNPSKTKLTLAAIDSFFTINWHPFITPAYIYSLFAQFAGSYVGIFFTMVFLWPVTRLIGSLIEEKELKIKILMKMCGLSEIALVLSWFITYFVMFFITSLLVTIIASITFFSHSTSILLFLFFFLFSLCTITFSFMMSTLFSNSRTGSIISAIVFLAVYFIYMAIPENASIMMKLLASLSPNVCLSLGVTTIAELESAKIGLTFNTLTMNINNFTLLTSYAMFILDSILFMLIAAYLEQVVPAEYGIQKPWYFPLVPTYWCSFKSCRKQSSLNQPMLHNDLTANTYLTNPNIYDLSQFNEPFTKMETYSKSPLSPSSPSSPSSPLGPSVPDITIRDLRKTFPSSSGIGGDDFVAVKGISLDMYRGEIFALLGENGAGKSTTIAMLTGLIPATSGNATFTTTSDSDPLSLSHDLPDIYRNQGVCLQQDVIYPSLSVLEHLDLYADIKGVPKSEKREQIDSILEQVGLGPSGDDKGHALAGTLSGGQKRKLSLAMAFLNKPSIVYLDEISSGVDVESRRDFWKLLLSLKKNRVIVLTSHSMDEVEYLSDRIAIMASGQLMCCGSSRFLKDNYGVGYTLTITKSYHTKTNSNTDSNTNTNINTTTSSGAAIANYILPNYTYCELVSDAAGEIVFRMPFSASEALPELFDDLDTKKEQLAITSYNISVTNLTEVFVKVVGGMTRDAVLTHQPNTNTNTNTDSDNSQDPPEASENLFLTSPPDTSDEFLANLTGLSLSSFALFFHHFKALFIKRALIAKRDKKAFLFGLLYPSIILIFAITAVTLAVPNSFPSRTMSPSLYTSVNPTNPVLYVDNGNIDYDVRNLMLGYIAQDPDVSLIDLNPTWNHENFNRTNVQNELLHLYQTNPVSHSRTGLLQLNTVQNFPVIVDSTLPPKITANIFFNYTAPDSIVVYSNYLSNILLKTGTGSDKYSITSSSHPFPPTSKQKDMYTSSMALIITIAMCFIPATYAAHIVSERTSKVKHLHHVSGVSGLSYWTAIYTWDVLNFTIPFLVLLVILAIFNIEMLIKEFIGSLILLCWLFIFAIAPFTYCFTYLFDDPISAQNLTLIANIVFSIVLLIMTIIMNIIPSTRTIAKNMRFVYRIFPSYCFGDAISFIMVHKNLDPTSQVFDLDVIGWDIIFLVLEIPVYFGILALLELKNNKNVTFLELIKSFFSKPPAPALSLSHHESSGNVNLHDEEDDVFAERLAVEQKSYDPAEYTVIIDNLVKQYPARYKSTPFVAVDNICLRIKKGECFAFLGANGAGKTTTMKMLTGDEAPTSGSMTIGGYDVVQNTSETRRLLGYCPQFDALNPLLSAKEHLYLYARIKCISPLYIDALVEYYLKKLGLKHLQDRPAGTFSGGNKRKLNMGIALVGNSGREGESGALLILDEPSTGVDPSSRQHQQSIIASSMSNRALILISHQLDEVESLSDRISILASGKIRCMGSSSHLKNKYGKGFQITCQISPDTLIKSNTTTLSPVSDQSLENGVDLGLSLIVDESNIDSSVTLVEEYMSTNFSESLLLEQQQTNLKFRISNENISLSQVFRKLQACPYISSYSVSDTDLDQIFVQFIREDEERKRNKEKFD